MTQHSSKAVNGSAAQRQRWRVPSAFWMLSVLLLVCALPEGRAAPREQSFDDPMFKRCIAWMLDGNKGALIGNICLDEYEIPSPSLFLCARKVKRGFPSSADREGCALLFEEQAKKVRAGWVN
jgi:hypothetical protein